MEIWAGEGFAKATLSGEPKTVWPSELQCSHLTPEMRTQASNVMPATFLLHKE